jgi:hypothetical protein
MTMTTVFAPSPTAIASRPTARTASGRPLWPAAGAAGAVAALATMAVAAGARALDVSLKVTQSGGRPAQAIPIGGFGTMTLAGAVAGIVLAVAARRSARRPARGFVGLAVLGLVVSGVPDARSAADTATMLTLWLTHAVAAAIIVPSLAARLRPGAAR